MHTFKAPNAMIIAPHPDDAELGMGGTLAKMIAGGWDVCIVDLTDGEPTPFGSKKIRARETAMASKILGIKNRICLGLPNRELEPTLQNRKKLAQVIRQFRPDILFGPCSPDWHPDHVAATQLTEAARFEAKYHKTDMEGDPHWTPHLYYYYSPHRRGYEQPSFVVDISDFWHKKKEAVGAYTSQVESSKVNSPTDILKKAEIAARFFGLTIATSFGEPFISRDPICFLFTNTPT